jgi:hypothetical protein
MRERKPKDRTSLLKKPEANGRRYNYNNIVCAFIENCFHLSHKDTIVILDDTMFIDGWEKEWTMGPRKEKTQNNKISELARRKRDVLG